MNPYQPGEDNQDPYEVGYKAGAASRDAEVAELKAELRAISVALNDPRTDLTMTMVEVITELREQVKILRKAVVECLSSGKSKGAEPHGISLKAIALSQKALAATESKE